MKEQIIAVLRKWKDKGYYDFLKIADEIIRIAEFEELCKPDYAEMHMNDSVMQQNIDAALAEIKAELAEEKKSNKLLHEAMITAEKRGYDKALAESRAKMPSEDIDVAEMHMNDSVFKQNVNDAIAEKMPSEEEMLQMVAGHIPWLIASARNSKKYVNPFTSGHAFSEVIRILSENLSRELRSRMSEPNKEGR